jgi:uncharacterized membrane protein
MKKRFCELTKMEYPENEVININSIREQIKALIRKSYPEWTGENGYISIQEMNKFRNEYVNQILEEEKGELGELDKNVINSLIKKETLSRDVHADLVENYTVGQRIADKVALFGGSWKFIIIFMGFLALWIITNVFLLMRKPFDPYPFILLNLILSSLAAIQAPVIMMSQNRQETKDRLRGENDYEINLKAEVEIRQLHEKIDHLIIHQVQRLFELQNIQLELLEQLSNKT